jgi:hypothetical protein
LGFGNAAVGFDGFDDIAAIVVDVASRTSIAGFGGDVSVAVVGVGKDDGSFAVSEVEEVAFTVVVLVNCRAGWQDN